MRELLEFLNKQMETADIVTEKYIDADLDLLARFYAGQSVAFWAVIQFIEANHIE